MPNSFSIDDLRNLYEQYFDIVYRFFYYKTLQHETAEDLTSTTFLALLKQLKSVEIKNCQAYLFGIAQKKFAQHLYRKYREPIVVDSIENFIVEVDFFIEKQETSTLEERLRSYLPFVPEKQRQVIQFRLLEKCSLSEICERLAKDMNYVKTTQKRAIQTLRKLIACTPILTKQIGDSNGNNRKR